MPTREPEDSRPPHLLGGSGGSTPGEYRPLRLTARGALAGLVVVCFLTALVDTHLESVTLSGVAFVAVCGFTAWFVRDTDLLQLSVSPPMTYLVGTLVAEWASAAGADHTARAVVFGMGARLADVAPWLFLGTAIVLVVALFRGLPRNVRDFLAELRGGRSR